MLAYKDGERVRLVSRNGRDLPRRFRDIAATISKLSARSVVLDGEVAFPVPLRVAPRSGLGRRRFAAPLPTQRRERR
jgi:ATP-dependent DNA ligase